MSLRIECDRCKTPLASPGALMFSPPMERTVYKFHLCQPCWHGIAALCFGSEVETPDLNWEDQT